MKRKVDVTAHSALHMYADLEMWDMVMHNLPLLLQYKVQMSFLIATHDVEILLHCTVKGMRPTAYTYMLQFIN